MRTQALFGTTPLLKLLCLCILSLSCSTKVADSKPPSVISVHQQENETLDDTTSATFEKIKSEVEIGRSPPPPPGAKPRFVDNRRVRLRFVGNHAFADRDLLARVWADKQVEEQRATTPTMTTTTPPLEDVKRIATDDRARLRYWYGEAGYVGAVVSAPTFELSKDGRFLDITFSLKEGAPFRLTNIRLEEVDGNGTSIRLLDGVDPIQIFKDVPQGSIFSNARIAAKIRELTLRYRNAGYMFVIVDPITSVDVEHATVRVELQIHRGKLSRVERVQVTQRSPAATQRWTSDWILGHVAIAPDQIATERLLEQTRARLRESGVNVNDSDVSFELGSDDSHVVLDISMK
jgi:outer membrane protein assembly factor BamA